MILVPFQLDQIIDDMIKELGLPDILTKLGLRRDKRQALRLPDENDKRWTSPISYYYDDNIGTRLFLEIKKFNSINKKH